MTTITILPSVFKGPKQQGDFMYMNTLKEHENTLFLFNDNIEHQFNNKRGAGNAIMRQFNQYHPQLKKPKSMGIPTGSLSQGGFQQLDEPTKTIILNAFDRIKTILKAYKYDYIVYSVGKDHPTLIGTSLFHVAMEVRVFITEMIYKLKQE